MDKKIIKRLNIAFIVVIAISIIIPLVIAISISLLNRVDSSEWYWNLIFSDGPILLLVFFIVGLIAYMIGCANLAEIKGYSRVFGLVVGLLPIIGILILIFLNNKNKDKKDIISFFDRFKKIYLTATLATLLPIVILFATPYSASQTTDYKSKSETKTIQLVDQIDDKKITYETDSLIITFGMDDFQVSIEKFLKENPHMKNDKEIQNMLTFVNESIIANGRANLNDAPMELQERIHFTVADLLESGKFTLFDEKKNKFIKTIEVETYGDTCGPLCGSGGRRFIIPAYNLGSDKVFFETMDWIS